MTTTTAAASVQSVWFPIVFPGLNELVAARGASWHTRGGRQDRYNLTKRRLHDQALLCIFAAGLRPVAAPYRIAYEFHLAARRGDPSNIRAGAEKVILDALAKGRAGPRGWTGAGIVHCDGFHCYRGLAGEAWRVRGEPGYRGEGVLVTLQEARP